MQNCAGRAIVFAFMGAFALGGVLLLGAACVTALHRAEFINAAEHADGEIVDLNAVINQRRSGFQPEFRFTADDGRLHFMTTDVNLPGHLFRLHQHVDVLYLKGHPERALIDSFLPLWLPTLIPAIVGACFLAVPLFVLVNVIRRRTEALTQSS